MGDLTLMVINEGVVGRSQADERSSAKVWTSAEKIWSSPMANLSPMEITTDIDETLADEVNIGQTIVIGGGNKRPADSVSQLDEEKYRPKGCIGITLTDRKETKAKQ